MEKATRRFEQSDNRGTMVVEFNYSYGASRGAAEIQELLPDDAGGPPGYSDRFMRRHAEALAMPVPSEVTIRVSLKAPSEDKPRIIEISEREFHLLVKSVRRNLPGSGRAGDDLDDLIAGRRRGSALHRIAVAGH